MSLHISRHLLNINFLCFFFMKISKIIGTLVNYILVKILVNWPLDTFTYFCNVFIQLICFLIRDLAKIW